MKNFQTLLPLLPLLPLALSLGLAACKTPPPPPVVPQLTEAQKAQQLADLDGQTKVDDGISLYQGGYYSQAESKFLAPEIWKASPPIRVNALKYLAFTYCVSERRLLCRQAFERALQLDPGFTLDPAESSHPLWGPEFQIANTNGK